MGKYYVLQQVNATGNGSTTTTLLVTNPRIENGAIYATKVGIIDTNRSGFVFADHAPFLPGKHHLWKSHVPDPGLGRRYGVCGGEVCRFKL